MEDNGFLAPALPLSECKSSGCKIVKPQSGRSLLVFPTTKLLGSIQFDIQSAPSPPSLWTPLPPIGCWAISSSLTGSGVSRHIYDGAQPSPHSKLHPTIQDFNLTTSNHSLAYLWPLPIISSQQFKFQI